MFSGAPSFTPDGSGIVFARYDPATNIEDIWSMDLVSGIRHEITAGNGFGASAPEVHPDGRTLSFVAGNETDVGFGLYTCAMDGSGLRQLVPVSADLVDKQDWAPDGRRLAASDNHDHIAPGVSENVFSVRPDGTHPTYLTHFVGGDVNAVMGSYSPDGHVDCLPVSRTTGSTGCTGCGTTGVRGSRFSAAVVSQAPLHRLGSRRNIQSLSWTASLVVPRGGRAKPNPPPDASTNEMLAAVRTTSPGRQWFATGKRLTIRAHPSSTSPVGRR